MDKIKLLEKVNDAVEKAELSPEQLFLFRLLEFDFSYDDEEKTCKVTCPVTETMLNPIGTVHGGIYTYLADTAIGHLNFRYKEDPYVSLEFKTSFFKTTQDGKLIATARYVKDGYNVQFAECVIENEKGEKMCTTTGTFYRWKKK